MFRTLHLPDNSTRSTPVGADNVRVGDFPSHLVRAPARPRFGRAKALIIWLVTIAACLTLT
ncbi:MAG: hypothetical protein QOE51_301, partial [Actinoplanes sp.]|nr:hypothetical protein [Actinoplanes sp.]